MEGDDTVGGRLVTNGGRAAGVDRLGGDDDIVLGCGGMVAGVRCAGAGCAGVSVGGGAAAGQPLHPARLMAIANKASLNNAGRMDGALLFIRLAVPISGPPWTYSTLTIRPGRVGGIGQGVGF